ncbi:MAG: response regulator transcription factor [Chitinophaga sp.]|uniref:response regulator transcription factor n=1 Tax=Chitinophaga sp. TaxID=1869181 RepID=UPI0025C32B97|nr:response regulator transcription factor [Chitinophaga sp.]MBV8252100.1 response regulator transcription factor [Chitinophaga sp.]
MKVLIVEDEQIMAQEMTTFLKTAYTCEVVGNAVAAIHMLEDGPYDFLLLDLGLPDMDGLQLLREARKISPDAAIIILTARGQLEDRIKGLDLGADDYLPKPFSLLELQSRMQAIARRKFGLQTATIQVGDFHLDIQKRCICFNTTDIDLSRKEFDLLSYMVLHKNRPLTRMQLSEHIWGDFGDADYDSNFIDVHIKNIRKKLSAYGTVEWLTTIRNVGYKIKL